MSNFALSPGTEVRSAQRTYTIQRVLGQGGFGITYLVKTTLKMGKLSYPAYFALKEHFIQVLCERDATTNRVRFMQSAAKEVESSMRAFVSEAQRLQRLGIDHRNIVNVDEVFEANGTAYYVMEYLDGGSLANYVKTHGGRLSWADITTLMQPICEAVALLHSNRVAHYDIKPMNIMVMTDDQGLRPVLIDFGLAKHYDGQGQATSTLAAGGYTPGYAPMEQYGGLRQFSPTADVYALAATICFCLTGHAPSPAAELNIDALCDELLSIGVNDGVVNVLLRALEYRPNARPADAAALTAALFKGAPVATVRKPRSAGADTEVQVEAVLPSAPAANAPKETVPREPARREPQPPSSPTQVHPRNDAPTPTPRPRWLAHVAIVAWFALILTLIAVFGGRHTTDTTNITTVENYRTTPRNLDLQVTFNGEKYYFSQSEWAYLSSSDKSRFNKQGVVIDYNGQQFIVKLNVERHGDGYKSDDPTWFTWEEAKQWVNNMSGGWRLPTYDEGKAITPQYEAVSSAIRAFGGDDEAFEYWTSTEVHSCWVGCFSLCGGGYTVRTESTVQVGVRAVRAI